MADCQRQKCLELVQARLGAKVSGADMRATIIYVYKLLEKEKVDSTVQQLLLTIITVSKILYLDEEKRTPKQVLSLYNRAWLHMELCKDLFPRPKKLTRRKLFGTYLHALTAHSPLQFEIISQKSVNTENQERLFGQARRAAEAASNRHPQNIISTVMLRLQAKKEVGNIIHSINEADSQVSKAAACLDQVSGTSISKSFVRTRLHSWQAHLERISPFLVEKRAWWTETTTTYEFKDGDDDQCYHPEGPDLLHFSTSSLKDVTKRQVKAWKHIADNSTPLPTPSICLYKEDGQLEDRVEFSDGASYGLGLTQNSVENETTELERRSTKSSTTPDTELQYEPTTIEEHQSEETDTSIHGVSNTNGGTEVPQTFQMNCENSACKLKTKLAIAIHKAIGMAKDLQMFDDLRHLLKTKQHKKSTLSQTEIAKHELLKDTLFRMLTAHVKELKQNISSHELDYFKAKHSLPNPDMDEYYKRILKRRNYGIWLLSMWHTL